MLLQYNKKSKLMLVYFFKLYYNLFVIFLVNYIV